MKLVTKILAATTASLVCLSLVATISVLAAAPSIAGVEITPDPAYTDTDLVAVPTGWEDGDEDEESYLWQWQKWDEDLADWVDIAGETTDTLANSNFNAGDQLKIICTPFDGTESGTAAEAVITISGGIVTIAPSPAYIDTDLTATPSHWVKLGEDELVFAYQWQQWDEDMADWVDIAGETTDTLLSANFAVGDRYQTTCTPDYDGTPGDPVFAKVIIMGGIVEITPDPTYTDTDLVAMPLHWPTPTEGTLTFTYKWYKWDFDLADFTLLAGEESATLASGNFIKRDELKVELTPSVDDVAGTPVEDTAVISNSPPSVTDVVITPDPAATDSTLTATPSGWVDADGDPEGYQWQWQKWDGIDFEDIVGATTSTLDNTNFTLGDQLKVICTPFDGTDAGEAVEATASISILIYDTGIDVKPGSDENPINLTSRGVIPVVIYTTEGFDAADVDVSTVRFGPAGALPVHYALEDVDGDGDLDLILHFRTQEIGITAEDTSVTLTGETIGGTSFIGTNSITIVPSKAQEAVQGNDESPGAENGNPAAPGLNKEPGQPAEGTGKANAPGLNKEEGSPATGKGKNK